MQRYAQNGSDDHCFYFQSVLKSKFGSHRVPPWSSIIKWCVSVNYISIEQVMKYSLMLLLHDDSWWPWNAYKPFALKGNCVKGNCQGSDYADPSLLKSAKRGTDMTIHIQNGCDVNKRVRNDDWECLYEQRHRVCDKINIIIFSLVSIARNYIFIRSHPLFELHNTSVPPCNRWFWRFVPCISVIIGAKTGEQL